MISLYILFVWRQACLKRPYKSESLSHAGCAFAHLLDCILSSIAVTTIPRCEKSAVKHQYHLESHV